MRKFKNFLITSAITGNRGMIQGKHTTDNTMMHLPQRPSLRIAAGQISGFLFANRSYRTINYLREINLQKLAKQLCTDPS